MFRTLLRKMSVISNLPSLPNFKQINPVVTTVLGLNPGPYTLQGTNTYVVGTGKQRILIDTAQGITEYPDNLKTALQQIQCDTLSDIIITHWHHDHTGGLQQLLTLYPNINVHKYNTQLRGSAPDTLQYQNINATTDVKTSHTFKTDGATLTALHTPGHTSDHICLYLHEQNALFCGDTVLGNSTAIFSSLKPYMQSLQTIVDLKPSVLYSAHGETIHDGIARVQMYITHRQQRESQILNAINKSNNKLKAVDIVKQIYIDLDERVIPAATNNVVLHLEKLVLDNAIAYQSTDGSQITNDIDDSTADNSEDAGKQRVLERSEWLWFSKNSNSKSSL